MRSAGRDARGAILRLVAVTVLAAAASLAHAGVSSAQTATTVPIVATAAQAPTATAGSGSAGSAGLAGSAAPGSVTSASATTTAKAGDNASTRTVNRIIGVLVFFGVALLALAAWFWWATKPVPRHLDALDAMSSRSWRQAGAAERSAMLAPVHERRAEMREEEFVAASAEPVEGPESVVEGEEAEPAAAVEDVGAGETPQDVPEDVPAAASLAAPLAAAPAAPEEAPPEPAPRP
jgi:hypothetical protein